MNLIRNSYTERQRVISSNDNKWQLDRSNLYGYVNNINVRCTDKDICIGITINPLAPEFFFLISAHSVYKMWIIQEPNKLALWNKLHFEEKKTESIEHV